jgi:adenylate kinase family enzyme
MSAKVERVVIIGTSCSGKSHLGKILARKYQAPHIELDDLHWLPDWQERPDKEFISLVKGRVALDKWIIDGNYSVVRQFVWLRATTIIWLNYPLSLVLIRAIKRSFFRALKKERLFAGNVETFKQSFFSRDSIILWVLKTHRTNKEKYSTLLNSEWAKHAEVKVFTKPSQLSVYVGSV